MPYSFPPPAARPPSPCLSTPRGRKGNGVTGRLRAARAWSVGRGAGVGGVSGRVRRGGGEQRIVPVAVVPPRCECRGESVSQCVVECREVRSVPRALPSPPAVYTLAFPAHTSPRRVGKGKKLSPMKPWRRVLPERDSTDGKELKNRSRRGCAVLYRLLVKSRVNESESLSLWREAVARA